MTSLVPLGLIALTCLGCTTTKLPDFTLISTRSVHAVGNTDLEVASNRVRGEDKIAILLLRVGEASLTPLT